jgi:hypothetical protein
MQGKIEREGMEEKEKERKIYGVVLDSTLLQLPWEVYPSQRCECHKELKYATRQ